jgi:hypothetical protein
MCLAEYHQGDGDIGDHDGFGSMQGLIETDRFSRNEARVMRNHSLSRDNALVFPVSYHGITQVERPEGTEA